MTHTAKFSRGDMREKMSPDLTGSEVKEMIMNGDVKAVFSHDCGFCNSPVGWRIREGAVFFDSNCACLSRITPLRAADFEELATAHNIQRLEVHRADFRRKFRGQAPS